MSFLFLYCYIFIVSFIDLAQCRWNWQGLLPRQTNSSNSGSTGDTLCINPMCISAIVNGSTVEYALQSTGAHSLGYMAMGFGTEMENSAMVVMWPNSNGSVTLSQRTAKGHVMPTVDNNPPRVASLSGELSSASGSRPKFVYTIPANSDTKQSIIWSYGTAPPSSSAVDADLQQHIQFGTASLDLTKPLSTSTMGPPSSATAGPTPSAPVASTGVLKSYQKMLIAHGVMCAVGFLLFLPAGALLARYLRTFSPTWFLGHWIAQFGIAGPTIIAGIVLGIVGASMNDGAHLNDDHKKWGIAILVFYIFQCALGAFIHWMKSQRRLLRGRPLQNYAHAILGIVVIALGFYQVHSGYRNEWPKTSGRPALGKGVNIFFWMWIALVLVLYAAGLALLPRQYRQESEARVAKLTAVPLDTYRASAVSSKNLFRGGTYTGVRGLGRGGSNEFLRR